MFAMLLFSGLGALGMDKVEKHRCLVDIHPAKWTLQPPTPKTPQTWQEYCIAFKRPASEMANLTRTQKRRERQRLKLQYTGNPKCRRLYADFVKSNKARKERKDPKVHLSKLAQAIDFKTREAQQREYAEFKAQEAARIAYMDRIAALPKPETKKEPWSPEKAFYSNLTNYTYQDVIY